MEIIKPRAKRMMKSEAARQKRKQLKTLKRDLQERLFAHFRRIRRKSH